MVITGITIALDNGRSGIPENLFRGAYVVSSAGLMGFPAIPNE